MTCEMEAKDVMGIVSIGIVIDAIEAIDVIGIVSIVGGAVVDASDG